MSREELIKQFPIKRISPYDGMAVTAKIWEEAHEYHRQRQQRHSLFGHGPGILAGLQVVASDPPDLKVYILPGIAVDSAGQIIVLPEPVVYDFGDDMGGLLYLVLSYWASRPSADKEGSGEGRPLYIHDEFAVHARPVLPDTPWVELARVARSDQYSPLLDAKDSLHPKLDELDLRFRRVVKARLPQPVRVGVSYLGDTPATWHGQGTDFLARALNHSNAYQVSVDVEVPLDGDLQPYTLLYLIGQGAFELSREEMKALYAYIQGNGTVLYESCRKNVDGGQAPADASFASLLQSMGVELGALQAGHPLLTDPFLFAAPPRGFETEGAPEILIGDGVIASSFDYGCLWRGERRDGGATREDIRTATEWAENLLAYAIKRQGPRTKRGQEA